MKEVNDDWALREALLLCVEENPQSSTIHHATKGFCRRGIQKTTHKFPAPAYGEMDCQSTCCTVMKVEEIIRCTLKTFMAFISMPQNVQYHEDGVVSNDVIRKKDDAVLVRTVYHHHPPVEVITRHVSKIYHIPETVGNNEALQRFCTHAVGFSHDKTISENNNVNSNGGASPSLPSKVYVYAIHSVQYEGTVHVSSENIRGWIYLSAFTAYEMPGPCVHLTFVTAPNKHVAAVMGSCEEKISRIRSFCEMLQQMMSRGKLTLMQRQGNRVKAFGSVGSPLPRNPLDLVQHDPCVFDPPTTMQLRVLCPLLKLHAGKLWRFRGRQEGCDVEECDANLFIAAPPLLKAYRISTFIACSLATFFSIVGDPLQTHRYDPFLESSMRIGTQPEGEVVYWRYKRLATYSSLRDYCVLVNTMLLQPDMERESTNLLSALNSTTMVYIENAIHCNYRPHCEGYERQVVYAFGYIATSNAGDNCVQVHHIVCVDSKDNSNQRLELAMIQEHITRMAWVRQICEDTKSTSIVMQPFQTSLTYGEEKMENPNHDGDEEAVNFVEFETLEDVTSFVFTQESVDCMSHPTSLNGSVEELEGIFDGDSSEAGTLFQPASPVGPSQESDAAAHKSQLTPAITTDRNSWVTPTEEVEKQDGLRTTPHAQTELSPSKEYFVFKNGSKQRLPTPQRDFLQVEIVSYRNFLTWSMAKNRVIFFIFRTSAKCAQTARVTFKENSLVQHERLLFEGPQGDAMTLIVVVRTSSGRMKRLGKAVMSLRNIRESEPQTRWVALVRNSGKNDACVCGEVCITLRGGGLNAQASATSFSEEAEESLRNRIRDVLMTSGRRHLYRLEWLVGHCRDKSPSEVDILLASYKKREHRDMVILTVFDVQGLITEKGVPLVNGPVCQVWVEANSVRHCSRTVPLQQVAVFKESFQLLVGAAEAIRLTVAVGGFIVGKVLISASPERFGGVRTHTLFRAAGTKKAMPSGVVTISLSGDGNQHSSHRDGGGGSFDPLGEAARTACLRLVLWKYARHVIHRLDVISSSLCDVDHYIKTLGPCPPRCDVRVSVKRWEASVPTWDSPVAAAFIGASEIEDNDGNGEGRHLTPSRSIFKCQTVYAVIHAGLHYYKSSSVRVGEDDTAYFDDPVTFHDLLPERDEVLVSIVGKGISGTEVTDLGTTVFTLRTLVRKQTMSFTVPLVRHAGSGDAYLKGCVQVELFAMNFSGDSIAGTGSTSSRLQVQRLLYHYAPQKLHRVETLLLDHAGREEKLVRSLLEKYGPDVCSSPMEIRLIGIRHFTPANSCYVKVYLNGEPVLRSSQQSGSTNIIFSSSDVKNAAVVMLDDPQHARLRFKVAQHRYLQSTTMSFAELRLGKMVAGSLNECWIPLFDSHGEEIGRLGVTLKCNGFICRKEESVKCEEAERDVISLLRKYKSEALPFLQPLITEAGSASTAHAEIRRRVAKRPVAATVYVCVESLSIMEYDVSHPSQVHGISPTRLASLQQENEGMEYTVTASCDHEEGSVIWSERVKGSGSVIRLDIPEFSRREDHRLTIAVKKAQGVCFFSRSGSKQRSISRGRRSSSPQRTAPQQLLPPTELGRVVVSLRGLLTGSLYDTAEHVTFPLVSFTQSPAARKTLQQERIQQQRQPSPSSSAFPSPCHVVGKITFSVRLPAFERAPSWLQLNLFEMEKHFALDRACIRYYEERIRNILAKHEPQSLLDLHYTLYERDVAHGTWSLSLCDRVRTLLQRLGIVEEPTETLPIDSSM
ncbi:hypothetical protein MOQ_007220 [Trypanosoma cruzi marinkellei]|uniref:C2 domain-containing protein n=1 Tax=Trypanosoma cruzi marinkellei TaxID=85056 RepID=K2NJD4_TRYCR|nr:hypothetical protein MOQ_007220 [Trypanosoma cruzi marinkellei]